VPSFFLAGAASFFHRVPSCPESARFRPLRELRFTLVRLVILLGIAAGWLAGPETKAADAAATRVDRIDFQGWKNAWRLTNEQVEVVVVPQIGRVMSFKFKDGENVLWSDRTLDGKQGDATGAAWINFGGDKTWPAPEAEWGHYTKRSRWMPPPAFDALPVTARIDGNQVILTSPIDPFYGVRTIRRVSLQPGAAVMEIETTYERVSGEPSRIAIWVITQFNEPVAVYVPIPETSQFQNGHFIFGEKPWPQLTIVDHMLRVPRDPATAHKLGSDADRMLWVDGTTMCLVSASRVPGAEYPDRGASVEVYTNPDPKTYVELETLGPLVQMSPGDRIQHTTTYTLLRRTAADANAEARRVLGL
jgi:hypothetical protein